jgi:hypothetical protein
MGTWDYKDPDLGPNLPAVENSFNRFASLLTGPLCGWPGSSVTAVANEPDQGRVPDLLMTQFGAATDVALFYYVGHGLLSDHEETQLCLGLTGTVKDPHRITTTSMLYSSVRRALLHSQARTKLVILDCCHSRLAMPPRLGGPDLVSQGAALNEFLDEAGVERTYVLVAASRKYAYYEDKRAAELPQTFFTKYLADLVERGIAEGPSELTMDLLYQRLRATMKAGGHPLPAAGGDSGGDYPLCRNAAWRPNPSEAATYSCKIRALQNISTRSPATSPAANGDVLAQAGSPGEALSKVRRRWAWLIASTVGAAIAGIAVVATLFFGRPGQISFGSEVPSSPSPSHSTAILSPSSSIVSNSPTLQPSKFKPKSRALRTPAATTASPSTEPATSRSATPSASKGGGSGTDLCAAGGCGGSGG